MDHGLKRVTKRFQRSGYHLRRCLLINLRRVAILLAILVGFYQAQWLVKLAAEPSEDGQNLLTRSMRRARVRDDKMLEFSHRDPPGRGSSSCRFLPHSIPAEGKPDRRLRHPDDSCNQDEACTTEFERVCLTRREPAPPPDPPYYRTGRPYMDVVGVGPKCKDQNDLAVLYGGPTCRHMGKRLPLRAAGPLPQTGLLEPDGQKIVWKPCTFIIYCAHEGCDMNFFHAIALAYYSTYVAVQKLGLTDLQGIDVEFYESPSVSPNPDEAKPPELIRKARERHTMFLEAFRPASIKFVDISLEATVQHLGCYESVAFAGHIEWPWHCRTTGTKVDPMLAGFSSFIAKSLGFAPRPTLPREDHILYFKRETTVRTLRNSAELEAAFPVPYNIYSPGNSNQTYRERLTELIQLTQHASILFGMHGAGLTNAIFAAPDAVVIEVTNCYYRIPLYRNLAVLTGKNYLELVVAVDEGCKKLGEGDLLHVAHHGDHLTVNVNDLAGVLDQARIILQRARDRGKQSSWRR
ncbi:hypothetical protein KFL_005210020 [Klebsormidium nitens]|uniref:Glycosyltransferase 61 catalytic domain-containing protein n=1 Tax=Klebsormidium nitens TaxID=105231 RepID=A0A1Y1IJ17_KLENI|nr:hypothetical protein KFL_005210020 [Klebsormidium nitens]|eukprot:GAQ89429.1 hypothetical protein KFL_005210020 [Klebsormidium nitens]